MNPTVEASLSTLILSIASSATVSMGLVPDPSTKQTQKNMEMAEFNIDLIRMLKDKTKNNLSEDEQKFLDSVLADLQMKFIQSKEG